MTQSITLDEFAGQTSTHALRTPSTQAPKETWFKARCNASKRVCLSNARQVYRVGVRLFDRAGMKDAPDQPRSVQVSIRALLVDVGQVQNFLARDLEAAHDAVQL